MHLVLYRVTSSNNNNLYFSFRVHHAPLGAVRGDGRRAVRVNPSETRPQRKKIVVTLRETSIVEGISVVTLIRTDTTLDHSQKAEKV